MNEANKSDIWFEALEEIGEKPIMSYCIHSPYKGEIKWIDLPHKTYDGFGGIFYLAASIDQNVVIDYKLAEKKLSILKKIKSIFLYANEGNYRKTIWKNFNPKGSGESIKKIIDLNSYKLEELQKAAKKEKVTLNIFLLKHFDQLMADTFLLPNQERWWMIPVNTRTLKTKHSRSNLSSYLSLQIHEQTTYRQLQEMLIVKLKNGAYWVPLFFMKIFSFFGKPIIKKILLRYEKNTHSWAGVFTFLDYTISNDSHGYFADKSIIGVAPVTRAHSIACDVIKANNRVSICLHFHCGHDLILIENFTTKFINFLHSS